MIDDTKIMGLKKEIIQMLVAHFKLTNISIVEEQSDGDIIRFKDYANKVYLNLAWNDLLEIFFPDGLDTEYIDDFFKKTFLGNILYDISAYNLYKDSNGELKIWQDESDSYKDKWIIGFWKDKFAEFLIEENEVYHKKNSYPIGSDDLLCNFEIDNVKVTINKPSDTFKLLFSCLNSFRVDSGWEYNITVSLKNVKKSDIENYLQEALFLINIFNEDIFIFGTSAFRRTYPNEFNLSAGCGSRKFSKAIYIEPLCFYNEARYSSEETCFYYYYKVLEYFFPINRKIDFFKAIKKYSKNIDKYENLLSSASVNLRELLLDDGLELFKDDALNEFRDICSDIEKTQLKKLFNNSELKNKINELYRSYFEIEEKMDILRENETFAEKVYTYRNSIVHSKEISRKVPTLLKKRVYPSIGDKDWNEIIKELSKIVIGYFCYEGKVSF
jgi:hypothetical protein